MRRCAAFLFMCLCLAAGTSDVVAAGTAWGGDNAEWGAISEDSRATAWCEQTCCCCDNRPCVYPPMLGDQLGFGQFGFGGFAGGFGQFGQFGGQFGQFGGQFGQFGGQFGQFGGQFGQLGGQFGAPISVFRGAYKIAENESPVPQDRVFIGYNYYDNVRKVADVHRESPGFEKTFLDGWASIGLRAPAIQVVEDSGGGYGDFADLTIPIKFALAMNPQTGSVLSAGLAVTAPTGPNPTGIIFENGALRPVHSTLLQPFVGYYWKRDAFFVQGFHSVMTPTDTRDVTALFNDVGMGYWLESWSGPVTAIVPTLEIHVNTPLNHSDPADFPRYRNSVNLTGGATVILNNRLTIAGGIATPVSGPRLFDVEAIANANLFF